MRRWVALVLLAALVTMLLFGVESSSQATLDRLNKGTTVEGIVEESKVSREEGI